MSSVLIYFVDVLGGGGAGGGGEIMRVACSRGLLDLPLKPRFVILLSSLRGFVILGGLEPEPELELGPGFAFNLGLELELGELCPG